MNTFFMDTKLHECVLVRDAQAARDLQTVINHSEVPVIDTIAGLPIRTLSVVPLGEVWIISKGKNPGQVAQDVNVVRAMMED